LARQKLGFGRPEDRPALILPATTAEAIVHAELHLVNLVVDVFHERASRARKVDLVIAEIEVVVFELSRPVGHECVFPTAADRPAAAGFTRRKGIWNEGGGIAVIEFGPSRAALDVDKAAVKCIAQSAGQ
jgi:hypothetical protein